MVHEPLPPITVPLINSGETTILPPIDEPNKVYEIRTVQFVNRGKAREVELKEGVVKRWRGEIPKDGEITADFSHGWRFRNNTPLIVNAIGTPAMDVNVLAYSTVRVGM